MRRLLVATCLALLGGAALAAPKKHAESSDDVTVSDDDEDEPEPPAAKKKKSKAADAEEEDAPKKKKSKSVDDDGDEKPKKKKSKADSDDEDTSPKKKKSKAADADDEDAPPKKKKSKAADADDEDASPKKKKSKAADADDEDASPKKKKKSKAIEADDDDDERAPKHGKAAAKGRKHPAKGAGKVDPDEIEMDDTPSFVEKRQEEDPLATAPPAEASDSASTAAPAPVIANPLALSDRSLTLPKGRLTVQGGFPISVVTVPGATAGTNMSSTSEGLALGVTYGIDTNAEIGLDYAFLLNPGSIKGPLTVHGAYRWIAKPKLEVAVAAALAVDFIDTVDPATMTTSSATAFGLQLGAWARYRATPKVSLFTGQPALPNSAVSLSKLGYPLPPLAYQVDLGLNNRGAIAVELPIGVGVQAAPNIYAFASLNLANIRIANTQNAFLFRDFIPIALGAFYSLDKIDVGAQLADDLKQGADYLRFELVGRYVIQ